MNLIGVSFLISGTIFSLVVGESPYKVQILDSGQCPDYKDTIVEISNVFINHVSKDDYRLSATVKIKEDSYGPLYMGGKAQRCEDGKPEKCVHYGQMIYNDLCEELKDPKSFSYDLFNNTFGIVNPSCPFKKGTIKIDSKKVDVSKMESIAMFGKLWKTFLYFYKADKKTVGSCAYFLMQITLKDPPGRSRDRSKSSKKNG